MLCWHDAGTPYSADTHCDKNEIAFITEQHIKTIKITTSLSPSFPFTPHIHADKTCVLIILITGTGNFFLGLSSISVLFLAVIAKQLVFLRLPVMPDSMSFSALRAESSFRSAVSVSVPRLNERAVARSTSDPRPVYTPLSLPFGLLNFLG